MFILLKILIFCIKKTKKTKKKYEESTIQKFDLQTEKRPTNLEKIAEEVGNIFVVIIFFIFFIILGVKYERCKLLT